MFSMCSRAFMKLSRGCSLPGVNSLSTSVPRRSELTPLQKRILVWTNRYPSLDKIPDVVPSSVWIKAKDKFRWRLAVVLMGLSIVGSGAMVVSGKRQDVCFRCTGDRKGRLPCAWEGLSVADRKLARARGETIAQRSLDWHEQLRPGSTTEGIPEQFRTKHQ